MSISFNEKNIFCTNCGSFNLEFTEDELLAECGQSKFGEVARCNRCGNFYTKEFIADNLEKFTSEEELRKVVDARRAYGERYRKMDEEREKESQRYKEAEKTDKHKKVADQKALFRVE
jgi:hypothetical protein